MKKRFISFLMAALTCVSLMMPASAATRGVNIPTQMAPSSWYDTEHNWTAKYYTYSSYIFSGVGEELWVDVIAPQKFSVEFVSTDGKYDPYTLEAEEFGGGTYKVQANVTGMTFYMIIRNLGNGSILSGATYNVFHPSGHAYPTRVGESDGCE